MKLSLVILALACFESCVASFWDQNGPRRPIMQRIGRERPRPMRHHRHIQPHHGYPRAPPPRMQRPMSPPGHRRPSRPPHFRNPQTTYQQQPQPHGQMMIQPMIRNNNNNIEHHPQQQRQLLEVTPPPYFRQDEIPEQSNNFPTIVAPAANFQSVGDAQPQPHGYLSTTYKGWKPIVKPYQNSFLLGPLGGQVRHEAHKGGLDDNTIISENLKNIGLQQSESNLNYDTLFRENTERFKSTHLKPAYSENSGIRVPPPGQEKPPQKSPEIQPIWSKRPIKSQSDLKKPSLHHQTPNKLPFKNPSQVDGQSHTNAPSSAEESNERHKLHKFKLRQRPPRPGPIRDILSTTQVQGTTSNSNNKPDALQEPTKSVLPPFPHKNKHVNEPNPQQQQQQHQQEQLNFKTKLSRGRVRIRTKQVVPQPQSQQSSEEALPPPQQQESPDQRFHPNGAEPSSLEAFHSNKLPQSLQNNFGPPPQQLQQLSNEETDSEHKQQQQKQPSQFSRHHHHQHHDNQHEVKNQQSHNSYDKPSKPGRGHIRHRPAAEQRPAFVERAPIVHEQHSQAAGVQESSSSGEFVDNQNTERPRGRRKKPKETEKVVPPPQQLATTYPQEDGVVDDYFPPGFHHPDQSKNAEQHPVSFMTMPGSKPQVIHHTYNTHRPLPHQQQQLYPINVMRSPNYPSAGPIESHNPSGTFELNNRPLFGAINVQNGAHGPPTRFPNHHHHQHPHNRGPSFPHHQPNNNNNEHFPPPNNGYFGPPPNNRQHTAPSTQHDIPYRHPPPRMQSTTVRSPQYLRSSTPPNSHSMSSTTFSSMELGESSEPYPTTRGPPPFSSTSPRSIFGPPPPPMINPHRTNLPPMRYTEYAPSYGSAEQYDKIPMQFMEHLRPILKDNPTTTSRTINSHQSPDIHPPASFFDDFFQPFDQTFNPNPDQELDSKPTLQISNQAHHPSQFLQYNNNNNNDGYNVEQSSPQPNFAPLPSTELFSTSPKHSDFSHSSTTLESFPTHDTSNDAFIGSSSTSSSTSGQLSWSKLQQENDIGISSTEVVPVVETRPKKLNKISQSKLQHEVPKAKIKEYHREIHEEGEKIPPVTTYKPTKRFDYDTHNNQDDETNHVKFDSHKVTSSATVVQQKDDEREEEEESNTPPSVYVQRIKPVSIKSTTDLPEASSTFKSRRHFRRRRPDASVRRRFFSSRVKSVPENDNPTTTTTNSPVSRRLKATEEPNPIEDNNDGFESSHISSFKQRRMLQKRRNLPPGQRLRGVEDTLISSSTTPSLQSISSSSESETATYGESQWFRIKPTDSGELELPVFKRGDSKNKRLESNTGKKFSSIPELLPLESSESSTEATVPNVKYSSKHSVSSYVDDRKRSAHNNEG